MAASLATDGIPGFTADDIGRAMVRILRTSGKSAAATMRDRPAGERVGDIGLLGVVPDWRGRGVGRSLLRWGVTTLRARGAGRIESSVEAANDRATGLYRAHGLEPAIEWPHWVLPLEA